MVQHGARFSRGVWDECFASDEERVENGAAGGDWQSRSHGEGIGWDGFLELPMGQRVTRTWSTRVEAGANSS
jgi:hypothetical protein